MKRIVMTLSVGLMLALLVVGCSGTGSSSQNQAPASGGSVQEIKIASFAFDPATLTIPVGTTVKWTNQDPADHTVTADDQSFDSGQLAQGKSFSFTFTKDGTFTYKCSNHSNMVGTIIVTK